MSVSTVILLGVILGLAVLAVRRLVTRGLCDCHDHCQGGCQGCKKKHGPSCQDGCDTCEAVKRMAATLHKA